MLIPKVMFVWVYFCKNDKSLIILKVLVFLFVELFNVELDIHSVHAQEKLQYYHLLDYL